ncbi:MAG: hypothetical protein UU48_C0007G0006 [Candidatus Uhrbacteria bacterium GW2011_GWF2_41_16]|uniref:Capsule synthesis protein CapA domain-containing protein n=2 Tax=Candidatus Uhriibacteriota TaxID=1752732 RepID=A0A0G0VA49_9BACT|nr:MAG: hypothetical protein UU35_C0010G0059 [Candidatus Uhrbacteria bacterium GW2011_GWC2_41_11]KKR97873.1 MAG: hypothetical protein UU48_C0007G0006 [Candidatus Uhrbacteria bacterium GW2011_GWF2_41_16]HBP00552.1 AmmeMemoRadiSam system protein B [Candidatus Uhrbacteria bacterium]
MKNVFEKKMKWIMRGALGVPLLVLGIVFVMAFIYGAPMTGKKLFQKNHSSQQVISEINKKISFFKLQPQFTLEEISGINGVMDVSANLSIVNEEKDAGNEPIRAAILPHHTLLADELGNFWKQFAVGKKPSVIVLVGPAHQNQGQALVQTTTGVWSFPGGKVKTDNALVSDLVASGAAAYEPASFEQEQSIGTHVPYIARLFPGVPLLPIIAKAPAGEERAAALVDILNRTLPDDALVVSSIDFSHYLPVAQSDLRDKETLDLIQERLYTKIDGLHADYLDSPFALDVFLKWIDLRNQKENLIWHESSGSLTGKVHEPGTSYFVFFAEPISKNLTLTAVGDVMLARAVASRLAKTTVETAFAASQEILSGSDLLFGNLESVLSSSSVDIPKEIRFKADPARTDVLKLLGFTHLSVSNNHIGDYGEAAWKESSQYLQTSDIEPVGGYRNDGEPVVWNEKGHQVIFLAFEDLIRPLDPKVVISQIQTASKLGSIMIVSFHWGAEYEHEPNTDQINLAHVAIDAGADLVIGHHPHVLQGVEKYKDGLILYSLGNFIFDQIGEDENETMVAKINWKGKERTLELIPMRIKGSFPRTVTDAEKDVTLRRVSSWSDANISDDLLDGMINW